MTDHLIKTTPVSIYSLTRSSSPSSSSWKPLTLPKGPTRALQLIAQDDQIAADLMSRLTVKDAHYDLIKSGLDTQASIRDAAHQMIDLKVRPSYGVSENYHEDGNLSKKKGKKMMKAATSQYTKSVDTVETLLRRLNEQAVILFEESKTFKEQGEKALARKARGLYRSNVKLAELLKVLPHEKYAHIPAYQVLTPDEYKMIHEQLLQEESQHLIISRYARDTVLGRESFTPLVTKEI